MGADDEYCPCWENICWVHSYKQYTYNLLEMTYIIQFDDGLYNYGPEGTPVNGHPVTKSEASIYTTIASAIEKLRDLLYPDGSGARIIPLKP